MRRLKFLEAICYAMIEKISENDAFEELAMKQSSQ